MDNKELREKIEQYIYDSFETGDVETTSAKILEAIKQQKTQMIEGIELKFGLKHKDWSKIIELIDSGKLSNYLTELKNQP